jgi:hypothetical protein
MNNGYRQLLQVLVVEQIQRHALALALGVDPRAIRRRAPPGRRPPVSRDVISSAIRGRLLFRTSLWSDLLLFSSPKGVSIGEPRRGRNSNFQYRL